MAKKAVIILSGGLDSTTCLAYAKQQEFECHTLTFDYRQKSIAELNAAKIISEYFSVKQHTVMPLFLDYGNSSALTGADIAVPVAGENHFASVPVTYVPARNTIFLSIALGYAEILAANTIFVGVNAIDYSGYPDCRPEYIAAFQNMANLATKNGIENQPIEIVTPLISLTKAEIVKMGIALGVDYSLTVSCYQADADGAACGRCESCDFRRQGFLAAKIQDPTRYMMLNI